MRTQPTLDQNDSRPTLLDSPQSRLARQLDGLVDQLDLSTLLKTYSGRGKKPHPPHRMLKIILYEIQQGRNRPAHWFKDTKDSKILQWLGNGIQPARSVWYEFAHRVGALLDSLHQQVLRWAQEIDMTQANQAVIDGTLIGAASSRHRMRNPSALNKRLEQLEAQIQRDQTPLEEVGQETSLAPNPLAALATTPREDAPARDTLPVETPPVTDEDLPAQTDPSLPGEEHPAPAENVKQKAVPGWMAKTAKTRRIQQQRYRRAAQKLETLLAENAQRSPSRRRDEKQVVISPNEPDSLPGRDKEKVFRPLYNVQWVNDLHTPLILGYGVYAEQTDTGLLPKMLQRTRQLTGRSLEVLLGDASYVSGSNLATCQQEGVALYGPYQENDYRKKPRKPAKHFPRERFEWLEDEQTYRCPAGHCLTPAGRERSRRSGDREEELKRFQCSPAHCQVCPLRDQCTPSPDRGRRVTRREHQGLLDAHQQRMQEESSQTLYRQRRERGELPFADGKSHRGLRRFSFWGRMGALTQTGLHVMSHNLLAVGNFLRMRASSKEDAATAVA